MARCLEIERATAPANQYLADVADEFTTTRGELTLGVADGRVAGFGKLTVLFDGSAWLELLRVHPDYQRQGVGKHIYARYLEQVRAFGCRQAAMYTGVRNVASAALAGKNGLHRGTVLRGMSLDVAKAPQMEQRPMELAGTGEEVARLLRPLEKTLGGRLNINHTFYAMNDATYGGFAARGWVYHNAGSLVVMGARFQPKKALYIAALQGDRAQGLAWALAEAKRRGVPRVTAHFPVEDSRSQAFYEAYGFAVDPSDDVVMEGSF